MPEIELVAHNPFWTRAYQHERKLLLEALFPVTGPLLIEHIGSTSIKNIAAKDVIDIMVGLTQPLSQEAIEAFEKLGYDYMGEAGIPGRFFFKRDPRTHHVHVVQLGHDHGFWWEHLLFRDYLRSFPEPARRYEQVKLDLAARFPNDRPSYTSSKSPIIHELLAEAIEWESHFGPVRQIQQVLQQTPFQWAIAGGWALDLATGKGQRHHEDIDVMVYRKEQLGLQRFLHNQGWVLSRIHKGEYFRWLEGEELPEGDHQVHATHMDHPSMDLLFNEGDLEHWVYRRNPALTRKAAICTGPHGIRYLAPEVVLLYKSGGTAGERTKDAEDARRMFPILSASQKTWLLQQLPPNHPWHDLIVEDL
ncbi:GrpB family protein [Deinococcus cellulosilyticus]|uniref:Uncharacterized protein n=1 Tax=Deinococcus cellulosilyticus (strain DSM 18568 / NBRC 106333 / KACC 11606 / 5516J-15) TaxID=1223518 RepID=A0A511N6N2_DEIC1|nr:GrpB family protein [Deinococcus cellulosilyticus]GEM48127.1 hypothetical protein DC3_37620 [Deinococcus cellulosilyticus NBRC 106333 = KACC 11606]